VSQDGRGGRYKWTVLVNTTIGTLMATIDASIVMIALPAIFRGIDMNPLTTSNTSYLLWMLMGYMVVTAVLVVSFAVHRPVLQHHGRGAVVQPARVAVPRADRRRACPSSSRSRSSCAWSPPRPRGCAAAAVPAPGTRWPLIWYTTGTQR
jgi:hypothetical protein